MAGPRPSFEAAYQAASAVSSDSGGELATAQTCPAPLSTFPQANTSEDVQEQVARHTSALAIAKVAAIELPVKQWQELIPKLLESMQTPTGGTGLKQATLETFGYVCEEMGHFDEIILDQEQVNNVLTAVVQGTAQQEDKNVRLAAITARLQVGLVRICALCASSSRV